MDFFYVLFLSFSFSSISINYFSGYCHSISHFVSLTKAYSIGNWLLEICEQKQSRSSHLEVFLRKGFLKMCSKFTGEHPYRSVNLLHIFRTPFPKNISGWMLLAVAQRCSIKAWGLQVFSCEFCEISKNTFP